jgi:hypothetical protein
MIRIERERVFPMPVERGFSIITDVGNWPSYWPGLVRIEPESRWGTPGDQARLILRPFRREVELAMTLRGMSSTDESFRRRQAAQGSAMERLARQRAVKSALVLEARS